MFRPVRKKKNDVYNLPENFLTVNHKYLIGLQ